MFAREFLREKQVKTEKTRMFRLDSRYVISKNKEIFLF